MYLSVPVSVCACWKAFVFELERSIQPQRYGDAWEAVDREIELGVKPLGSR